MTLTTVVSETGFPGPDEIEGFWNHDKMHAPRPISPLGSDLIVLTLAEGFNKAHREFDALIEVTNRMINYYFYATFAPLADEVDLADRAGRYEQTLATRVPEVGRQWTEEWQPEIERLNLAEKQVDYGQLSDDEILARLGELRQRMVDFWQVHGRINFVLIAGAEYCDFYDEVMQPEDPTEAYQSIQGWETQSVAASRGLWSLSRTIEASEALRQQFADLDGNELLSELATTGEGQAFLADLREYLDEFGWRSDAVYDIADPTWRDDPAIPLSTLKSYVGLGDESSPDVLLKRSIETRERLQAGIRAKLANDPERMARFETLYNAAKYANPVTENHAFWIDQLGVTLVRRFAQEIGQRLAAKGVIGDPADVFMLYHDEVVDALRNGGDRRDVASQRRAEMDQWAQVSPPPVLGTPPPPPPTPDPFVDALVVRLLGITPPSDEPPEAGVLKGVAGSAGLARGTARVVKSLSEASKLNDGDIMVCEMTLPPWVPLFSVVAGIVADTGGVLSHCAIVAREFELPAVVGTQVGTIQIPDGATVEVNGTKGTVTILDSP
jgi:pyruvate,water dikinase